jgi:hypothetical protein
MTRSPNGEKLTCPEAIGCETLIVSGHLPVFQYLPSRTRPPAFNSLTLLRLCVINTAWAIYSSGVAAKLNQRLRLSPKHLLTRSRAADNPEQFLPWLNLPWCNVPGWILPG